jgi:STE24 endopeptidase
VNETRATRYQRLKRRAHVVAALSGGAMLAVIALTPLARLMADAALQPGLGLPPFSQRMVSLALFLGFVVLLWQVAALPAVLYLGLRVDRRYGRSSVSVDDLLIAQAQTVILVLPAALIAGVTIQGAASLAGPWWWIVSGVALAVLLLAAMQAAPRLLARLAGARRLERDDLLERLAALARRAAVPIEGVYVLPAGASSGTTALVSGVGGHRSIFISSELIRHWTDDEIAVVLAHELGHHAHGDLWRTLALDAGVLSGGLLLAQLVLWSGGPALGLRGAADPASLPCIALVTAVAWSAVTPLRHAVSRRQERRADAFALALTGGADAFDAAIRRLATRHLAEERPSPLARWLFHAHPTIAERLDYTRAYRELAVNPASGDRVIG